MSESETNPPTTLAKLARQVGGSDADARWIAFGMALALGNSDWAWASAYEEYVAEERRHPIRYSPPTPESFARLCETLGQTWSRTFPVPPAEGTSGNA